MKHKHMLAVLCGSMICLAACQNESEVLPAKAELAMSVVARIGDAPLLKGRYVGEDPDNVEFAEGDAVGIFVDDRPVVRWRYESLSWVPDEKVYWADRENVHVFKAFYPYASATSYEGIPMPGLQKQTGDLESVAACDFLVASVAQSYGSDGTVAFQGEGKSFRHVSSLVGLLLKAEEDLADATLLRVSLEGDNIVSPSLYSFSEGVELQPDDFSDALEISPQVAMEGEDKQFYLVVNEKLDETSTVVLTIEYEADGKTYLAKKEDFSSNVFQGGVRQDYTIVIRNNQLVVSGSQISAWEQGSELEDVVIDSKEKEE